MDLNKRISDLYEKYDDKITNAHVKIIELERVYRNRTRSENDKVIKDIEKIIEEVTNDN